MFCPPTSGTDFGLYKNPILRSQLLKKIFSDWNILKLLISISILSKQKLKEGNEFTLCKLIVINFADNFKTVKN